MKTKLAKILLTLSLLAILLPSTGCDPRRSGDYATSTSGFSFGLDWLPDFGGFDYFDDTVVIDEFVEEDDFGFDSYDDFDFFDDGFDDDGFYDDGFYDDGYYDDGFYDDGYYDDDWKKKSP